MITIALTKGRILKDTLPLLQQANVIPTEDIASSRKLVFETNQRDIRLLVLRGVDVLSYIRHGSADIGVVGKDMLMEDGGVELYELVDLNIARCRLMTAAIKVKAQQEYVELTTKSANYSRIKVATKYVNVARRYYAEQGIQADIIKLYGGMELAPIMGLADEIVDIVDTGNTLIANGLEAKNHIADISSRLVSNKASMKVARTTRFPRGVSAGQNVWRRAANAEGLVRVELSHKRAKKAREFYRAESRWPTVLKRLYSTHRVLNHQQCQILITLTCLQR